MNNQDIQNNTYREVNSNATKPSFTALSTSKKTTMRNIVESFFSYIKQEHS